MEENQNVTQGQTSSYDQPQNTQQPQYDQAQYNQQQYNQQPQYNNQPQYNQQAQYNQPVYGNGAPIYIDPQTGRVINEPQREPVKNVFFYILMALDMVGMIVAAIYTGIMFEQMEEMMGNFYHYSNSYTSMFTGATVVFMLLSMVLGIGIIVFLILDIVQVHKKGYPITGLILFAIFFRIGYFIWRAHATKQKKTGPIIYTVCYALVSLGYFGYVIYQTIEFVNMILYLYA
ncbi:MAG: hypothetical protein ACI4ES_10515 [Roseburia sp.]